MKTFEETSLHRAEYLKYSHLHQRKYLVMCTERTFRSFQQDISGSKNKIYRSRWEMLAVVEPDGNVAC